MIFRRRVQFGRSAAVYALIAVMTLGSAINTQANLLFWLFGLLVGAVAISLIMALLGLRFVELQRLLPDHAIAGQEVTIRYRLTSGHRFLPMFNLVIQEAAGPKEGWVRRWWRREKKTGEQTAGAARGKRTLGPGAWTFHLGPGQTILASATCLPPAEGRGEWEFGRVQIASSFPFGVLVARRRYEQKGTLLVYPAIYRLRAGLIERLARQEPGGGKTADRPGGDDDFFGLRDYRSGDNIKLIDWKHSARSGRLICREMARPQAPGLAVLLDLSGVREGQDQAGAEEAISLAASLVCEGYLRGFRVGLGVLGVARPVFYAHHSRPHRDAMLAMLAKLPRPIVAGGKRKEQGKKGAGSDGGEGWGHEEAGPGKESLGFKGRGGGDIADRLRDGEGRGQDKGGGPSVHPLNEGRDGLEQAGAEQIHVAGGGEVGMLEPSVIVRPGARVSGRGHVRLPVLYGGELPELILAVGEKKDAAIYDRPLSGKPEVVLKVDDRGGRWM
ncbi:MAG: DUF58 domain-containing protein [Phycisphaeraceae bacterium]|nr:DUF58 domain-containing protein [Phycisphaeraceae bacterium]